MRLLCPIVLVLLGAVDSLRDQFPMGNSITTQLVGHNLPGLSAVTPQKPFEKAFGSRTISLCLKIHIHHGFGKLTKSGSRILFPTLKKPPFPNLQTH
jgi:hypothetical protein